MAIPPATPAEQSQGDPEIPHLADEPSPNREIVLKNVELLLGKRTKRPLLRFPENDTASSIAFPGARSADFPGDKGK